MRHSRRWMGAFAGMAAVACVALVFRQAVPRPRSIPVPPPLPIEMAPVPTGSFTLYVSNQSFDRPTVDITVSIDGRVAVSDAFPVMDQHNWVAHRFELAEGKHQIVARSVSGEANFSATVLVPAGRHWAVLDYWCHDTTAPSFSWDLSDKPIGFL